MLKLVSKLLLGATLLVGGTNAAYACSGPAGESRSLLNSLPATAKTQPIVAYVKVLDRRESQEGEPYGRISIVQVVKAIKGVRVGDKLSVLSEGHSCAGDLFSVKVGESYYIAGAQNDHGTFIGIWRGYGKDQRIVRPKPAE